MSASCPLCANMETTETKMQSLSVSSEDSVTSLRDDDEDDTESVCSDELLGSHSRRWLAEYMGDSGEMVGQDGLYVDMNFPLRGMDRTIEVKWKRPKEMCSSPQFIVNGATRLDVRQGQIGDCWLLSAIASLSMHRSLLTKVVPLQQSFQNGYNGSFTFSFWQYGQWLDVRIDDLLPTYKNELIYLSSPVKHEFWSSLLEKAYAKLKGGYRALNMGFPHEAMVDMTGGVTEVMKISMLPKDLPTFLKDLLAKGALISCANCEGPLEQKNELGIMYRHAYSLTAVEKIKTSYGSKDLVRILNPWGDTEWEGPWSDLKGPEWNAVSPEEQQRLGRVRKEDGEFWMSVSDFRQYFELIEVCYLTEGLDEPGSGVQPMRCITHHGHWETSKTAGGPLSRGQFWQNPQFHFILSNHDNDGSKCTFILALMQKHQRRRGTNLSLGLHIYPAHPQSTYLSQSDFDKLRPPCSTSRYSSRREITLHGKLPPGHYIIIPSTSQPNQQGEFLLRVLTEQGDVISPAHEHPQDEGSPGRQAVLPSPKFVKQLFMKHCNKKGFCKPVHLYSLLTEAIMGGALSGSEKYLALEHCKSMVVLNDSRGIAQMNLNSFYLLWNRIHRLTDIFLAFDKNQSQHLEAQEVGHALEAAGIKVDPLIQQLVELRYMEPDRTISYPGFLYLVLKLESMIRKFHSFDVMGVGNINVTYKQWLQMTMYN